MNINQKINAKGNRLVFYTLTNTRMISLIRRNYYHPNEDINLPAKLFLDCQYMSNIKGH